MEVEPLLFAWGLLHITGWRMGPTGVTILAVPTEEHGFCPSCGHRSGRVHSRHCRKLQDLPVFGRVVCLELRLWRFFCDCADCPQRTFAQQIPEIARLRARRTRRVAQALEDRQPWSQGQVEGQINRLKLIKRQMYGRASFDLLRSRVLHARPA